MICRFYKMSFTDPESDSDAYRSRAASQMMACIILKPFYSDFWATNPITGRNVFHALALQNDWNSAVAMAKLLAHPGGFYNSAAGATDKFGNTPLWLAYNSGNYMCALAMVESCIP